MAKPKTVKFTIQQIEDMLAGRTDKQIADEFRQISATGRPRRALNLVEMASLCAVQATIPEIAAHFRVSEKTIDKRLKQDPVFAALFKRGKEAGRLGLRMAQRNLAFSGNPTMQIFLGKQKEWLGQRDEAAPPAGMDRLNEVLAVLDYARSHQEDGSEDGPVAAKGNGEEK